jgi:hypothetical protein
MRRSFGTRSPARSAPCPPARGLAQAEKINQSYLCRVLRLNLLAPDIVESALNGEAIAQS